MIEMNAPSMEEGNSKSFDGVVGSSGGYPHFSQMDDNFGSHRPTFTSRLRT